FPDTDKRSLAAPTLFQLAKALNFRTHLLEGATDDLRFGLERSDMQFVDDWRNQNEFGDDPDTDRRIATVARQILAEPGGHFMIITKRGNHFPYLINSPAAMTPWSPDRRSAQADSVEAWTNTYDNAIRYNLDGFWQALLDADGSLPRTLAFYTSDH